MGTCAPVSAVMLCLLCVLASPARGGAVAPDASARGEDAESAADEAAPATPAESSAKRPAGEEAGEGPEKPAGSPPKFTGWGAPFGTITSINRQVAGYIGLMGGIHFPRVGRGSVFLGGALNYLLLPLEIDPDNPSPDGVRMLNLNHGGLVLGGVFARRDKRVRFGIWGLAGGGGGCLQNRRTGDCEDRHGFFVGEPSLFMHVVLVEGGWLALSVSAGFRFIAAAEWSGPSSWQLAGPVGQVALVISRF